MLRDLKHAAGSPPVLSDRMVIEAVLSQARTGTSLARPARRVRGLECRLPAVPPLGKAHPLETAGGAEPPQQERPPPGALHRFDDGAGSSARRRGPQQNGGQSAQALGRSRGGLSTKLHVACPDDRIGVSFVLSGGERHDAVGFEPVWQRLPAAGAGLGAAVRDEAYASQRIRHVLGALGIEAVIPPRATRTEALAYDPEQDKVREQVERFFNKLKPFRRMATRDEKLSRTFLALIHLVSTWIMLRSFFNTA